ncbi:uncharacterized protein LOC143079325 [Mytilus galloprovincialis]|uniref:uncharacterized protein LOC143079325 n=1 Tax=Mytilus galloprovincialis TaxID=29158 RepID=UPI003F7C7BCD
MLLAKFHAFNALTGTDVVILLLVLLTGPIGMIGLLGYAVYIFKYIKKKTWRDVQCKDVAIVILLIFTYGMVIPIAWKVWRVGATKTPKTPPDEPMKRRNVEDDHEPMNGRNVVD